MTSIRTSVASVALICNRDQGHRHWLAQWNARWQKYNFVSGHKNPEETFRACIAREVSEELGLLDGRDFQVAESPAAQVEFDAWSESSRADTHYVMELFEVELIGAQTRQDMDANPDNRWLTEPEIFGGRSSDGKEVSDTMAFLLRRLEQLN